MVRKRIGLKILFIGDSGVGKTSLKNRLIGLSDGEVSSTIGIDISSFKLNVSNITLIFSLFDIGGQKHYSHVRDAYYNNPHLVALVFDTSNKSTLFNLLNWINELENSKGVDLWGTPFILVGNKIDLVRDVESDLVNYLVDSLRKKGLSIREIVFVSAKTGENVDKLHRVIVNESVRSLIRRIRERRKYALSPL